MICFVRAATRPGIEEWPDSRLLPEQNLEIQRTSDMGFALEGHRNKLKRMTQSMIHTRGIKLGTISVNKCKSHSLI